MTRKSKMTKEKLIKELERLEEENGCLYDDVDYFIELSNDYYEQLKKSLEELKKEREKKSFKINNIENFLFKLKINHLLNEKLKKFIDDYLKYENL